MEPIDIGSRLELFVDRHLLAQTTGSAALRLHHPQPVGPAIRFDRPWEGAFSGYCTMIEDDGRYRLYYRGWPESTVHEDAVACVAESSDGVAFERPDLGICDVRGDSHTNAFLARDPATHNFAPMLDDRPGVGAEERYKALADHREGDARALAAYVSADGVQWRKMRDEPVITEGAFDSQNVPFWSHHEGCYLCYFRVFTDGYRSVARARSDDFLTWSEPEQMHYGDTPPEQLYTNQTTPYFHAPHIYVSLPGRFMLDRQVLPEAEARTLGVHDHKGRGYWLDCADAVLMTSRGGDRYDRTFMEAFVRPGRDRRNWTSRCNYPACGIIRTGDDEMSIYVERHNAQDGKYLERLRLRLDGFSSLYAGYDGGVACTQPLVFSGSQLVLNYETSAAGHLRVEIRDESGSAIPGYAMEDCTMLVGDEIERSVSWGANTGLAALAGRPVRVAFELKDADVFSMRFAE